jgi:adenylate cyclase
LQGFLVQQVGSSFKQRLAAILAADVAGYSRLMSLDERATVEALDAARRVFRSRIESNQGRIIDMAGDSVLAVFETATGAVNAALAVQAELAALAADLPDDRRMRFRIGVHLGDVMEKADGSVYGDGVNIAARLEGLAEPGGITVSESIHAAVRGKTGGVFEDRGEQPVKNIAYPVRVFALRPDPSEPGPAASSFPDPFAGKPSIAVLAFDNMTGDPTQEFFCEGISEDIITDLSKIEGIGVIGRQSAFAYKGKANDLRRVCTELGVRYVLEGSVRKAGTQFRVTAQLIEGSSGTHLWAKRYDRENGDAFLVGDQIAEDIVASLDVKLARGEDSRVWRRAIKSVAARDLFSQGQSANYRTTLADNRRARELFLEAIVLEPDTAQLYASAAMTHVVDVMQGWSDDVTASLEEAGSLSAKAVALDDENAGAHYAQAFVTMLNGNYTEAGVEARRALSLRPMCVGPRAGLAYVELYSGHWQQARRYAQEAIRFNPIVPNWYLYIAAAAEFFSGQPTEALVTVSKVLERSPGLRFARVLRAAVLMSLQRKQEAAAEVARLLKDEPDFSLARLARTQPFMDARERERYFELLRGAGLPA